MSKTNTRMLLRCAVFAALTAVGAFIRIPFALSSITLQFFFTAMAGLVLGARWGAASQAIYVLLGLAGLPIFSAGGGAGYIFYPSFGFLLGLIPAAYVTGRLCGGCKRPARIALAWAALHGAHIRRLPWDAAPLLAAHPGRDAYLPPRRRAEDRRLRIPRAAADKADTGIISNPPEVSGGFACFLFKALEHYRHQRKQRGDVHRQQPSPDISGEQAKERRHQACPDIGARHLHADYSL